MSYAILLSESGKEVSRTKIRKRQIPLCGYEKGIDGLFYKKEKDPRIFWQEIVTKQSECNNSQNQTNNNKIAEVPSNQLIVYSTNKISITDFRENYLNYQNVENQSHAQIMNNVSFHKKLGIEKADRHIYYRKVAIYYQDLSLGFWGYQDYGQLPPLIVRDFLRWADE